MNRRRLALSAAAACLLVAIPATPVGLMGYTRYRPALLLFIFVKWQIVDLLFPGFVVSMLLASLFQRFFVTHPSATFILPLLTVLLSAAFWTAGIYAPLSLIAHRRAHRHRSGG